MGKGMLETFLKRDNTTIVAAVRDTNSASSKALLKLPTGTDSRVVLVKIDSVSETDAAAAVKELQASHGIDHLDVVVANAAISDAYHSAVETPLEAFKRHMAVNAVGPLVLFQAVAPLLAKSKIEGLPKFVTINSAQGSIGEMDDFGAAPTTAYGCSKAALNYMTRKIHYEHEKMISFALSPG